MRTGKKTDTRNAPVRFVAVGLANTAIDFGLLLWLTSLGMTTLYANMISTGSALTFSFFANRKFTFDSDGNVAGQMVKFLVVTLMGLWVLQPIVLYASQMALQGQLGFRSALVLGKVLATGVSMVWNYLLYKKAVFTSAAK